MNVLDRPDLHSSRALYEAACLVSRGHNAVLSEALSTYGDHGPDVSGVGRDHFPEPIKAHLRALARTVGTLCDAAWEARPTRVRRDTIRALGRAVAARDGCGFYGPVA